MPTARASPEERAVRTGYWWVVFPAWALMMALVWVPVLWLGVEKALRTAERPALLAAWFLCAIAAGWLWWSVAAPRWRLWAYQRVNNLKQLEQLAVADKLIWPASHVLTRTELRVGELGTRLKAYEVQGLLRGAR